MSAVEILRNQIESSFKDDTKIEPRINQLDIKIGENLGFLFPFPEKISFVVQEAIRNCFETEFEDTSVTLEIFETNGEEIEIHIYDSNDYSKHPRGNEYGLKYASDFVSKANNYSSSVSQDAKAIMDDEVEQFDMLGVLLIKAAFEGLLKGTVIYGFEENHIHMRAKFKKNDYLDYISSMEKTAV